MSEKIKNYLGLAIIVTILVFAYSSLQYVENNQAPPTRNFSVSGEGKVIAIPDIAEFSFSIITDGDTNLLEIQKESTEKINKTIDFVKANGVNSKDIKTQRYSVEPRYQYFNCGIRPSGLSGGACPPPEIVGYSIRNTISVKVRDFDNISILLAGIIENGANSVSSLNFTIDDRNALENEAREEAIKEARKKAKSIARAGNFKLGKIISINEGFYPKYDYRIQTASFEAGFEDSAIAPSPSIEPGSEDIVITVNIVYEIK